MGLSCGIVGLPNVGKSTLFNALTKAGISAQNYPFCTIEPNEGVVAVPDARLTALADIVNPQRIVPTSVKIVDIAGLVKGAAEGEGLGNKFLAHIREVSAILHMVRCFENPNVIHVDGKISPLNDVEVINTELALADLESVEKALLKVNKMARTGDKVAKQEQDILENLKAELSKGHCIRQLQLDSTSQDIVNRLQLLTAKPTVYIANVSENGFKNNPLLSELEQYAATEHAKVIPICAAIEAELAELEDEEKHEFLNELGLEEPGLNRVIRAAYEILNLQTFFTAGVQEVRAWTVKKGASAPQAAGEIHSDFERGFIRAEVISYADFIQCKGEKGAREAGKLRLEGKEYVTQDGDVMHFLFNV